MKGEGKLIVQFPWNLRDRQKEKRDHVEKERKPSRSAIYRRKVKDENPRKHEAQKETERERWHRRKQNPSVLSVEERRRKWASQKRIQRASKNTSTIDHHSTPRKKIREMSDEEKREYWRSSRKRSRNKRTLQKARSDKMKDKSRKREENQKRGKQKIVPNKYDQQHSPNIEIAFYEDGLKATIEEKKNSLNDQNRRSYYDLASVAKRGGLPYRKAETLGITRHVFNRVSKGKKAIRKKRRDTIPMSTKVKVVSFWLAASREYPCKKRVKRNRSIFVLTSTYSSVFRDFKSQHPQVKIGFIKFLQLRPNNIRKLKASERNVCCCPKCENAKYLVEALNQVCRKHNLQNMQLKGEKDLADLSVCPYTNYPAPQCLRGDCAQCVDSARSYFQPLMDSAAPETIKYNRWETVHEEKSIRDGEGGKKMKMVTSTDLVTKATSVEQLVRMTISEVNSLANHLFRARWQQNQFTEAKLRMSPHSGIMVIDFAQNYTCSYQDEVQAAHWSQNQVTIHAMVAYINTSDSESPATHTVNMVALSPDLKHDAAAAKVYCDLAHRYLKDKHGITKILQFSDCCAGHYRGKVSFADISLSACAERHYFESSHGKSAADGLSAVVKHSLTRAVTHKKALIRNAEECFEYCEKNLSDVGNNAVFPSQKILTENSTRKFFFVRKINRPTHPENIKPIKGTMKIHAVRSTNKAYEIQSRPLSCFCRYCTRENGIKCESECYTGSWTTHKLQQPKVPASLSIEVSEVTTDDDNHAPAVDDTHVDTNHLSNADEKSVFKVGSWVAVIYDDSWWPGVIESIQEEIVTINFMKPQPAKNRFSWPHKEEKDKIPTNEILCVLNGTPQRVSRRYFCFQDDVYNSTNALIATILQ